MKLGRLSILHRYTIGPPDDPYMIRFAIVKSPAFGLCIHKFVRSDYERALHDHPWWYASFVLLGSYVEEYHIDKPDGQPIFVGDDGGLRARTRRTPWSFAFRPAKWRHRVILDVEFDRSLSEPDYIPLPCWTLVLMGPRVRRWGFWLPSGWCWWRKHDPVNNICADEPLYGGGED